MAVCVFGGGASGGNGDTESGTPLGDVKAGDGTGLIGDDELDWVDECTPN